MGLRTAAETPLIQRDKEKAEPIIPVLLLSAQTSNYYRHHYPCLSATLIFMLMIDAFVITGVQNQTASTWVWELFSLSMGFSLIAVRDN